MKLRIVAAIALIVLVAWAAITWFGPGDAGGDSGGDSAPGAVAPAAAVDDPTALVRGRDPVGPGQNNGLAPSSNSSSAHRATANGGSDPASATESSRTQPDNPAAQAAGRTAQSDPTAAAGATISGQLLTDLGQPVADLPIDLKPLRRFATEGNDGSSRAQTVWSDETGGFVFLGLADGEYLLEVQASELYSPANQRAVSGSEGLQLVVREKQRDFVLSGQVSDQQGQPVGDVVVRVGTLAPKRTRADQDGRYEVGLELADESQVVVRFEADGYERLDHRLGRSDLQGSGLTLDPVLIAKLQTVTVSGTVIDTGGRPLPGQRIDFTSNSARDRGNANTDANGEFVIESLTPAPDYRLWVRANGPHQDYRQTDIDVGPKGAQLEVVLEALELGQLAGQMINPRGEPVAGLTLWVRQSAAAGKPVQITGDDQGFFFADKVPAGRVNIGSNSGNIFSVSGYAVEAGEETAVELVLDVGPHQLAGRVIDQAGRPGSGLQVLLSWRHRAYGILSSASRRALTDADGYFSFNQLSAGAHRLVIKATQQSGGYQSEYLVGTDNQLEIVLPVH